MDFIVTRTYKVRIPDKLVAAAEEKGLDIADMVDACTRFEDVGTSKALLYYVDPNDPTELYWDTFNDLDGGTVLFELNAWSAEETGVQVSDNRGAHYVRASGS